VVDVSPDSLVIETTGTEDKIDGLVEMLKPYGVLEMARTGRVAMSRGAAAALPAAVPAAVPADDELPLDSGISCSV
jgi:acetolactate synthase-1/3 small subunit